MSRITNSKRNVLYGGISQLIKIFSKFTLRTIIIYTMGVIYLGLDGLFLNVISILSLAELGIGNAICFALYKPLAVKDHTKIVAYMGYYKRIYAIIGLVIFSIGIAIIPFLSKIINFDDTIKINYYLIYFLFLFNSVCTYWFGAYRQVLFIADQKNYVLDKVGNTILIVGTIVQMLILIFTNNYYIYLVSIIFTSIFKNLWLYSLCTKLYVFLSDKNSYLISRSDKRELYKNIYALSLNRISTTIYMSSDNIVISAYIGTVMVGYYSNYAYIVSAITGFISILFSSVTSSIGNINALNEKSQLYAVFKKMSFINMWIYGFCFCSFWQLLTPFILIWLGDLYALEPVTVLLIALMFLIPGLNHTCTIFRSACGLFWQTRYRTLLTAITNIIISIILAPRIGISGVFIGTIMSYLLTTFMVDPKVVYKYVLDRKVRLFYMWYAKSFLFVLCNSLLVRWICSFVNASGVIGFILQLLLCVIVFNGIFYISFHKNQEFIDLKKLISEQFFLSK